MAITERKLEDQNPAQAPTLGMGAGTFGQQAQQRTNIAQGGSGRFTNLQQYIKANEANPNAQLLQREGTRRQEELGTRQGEFTRQAEPIKQQFEGIRSGQQFVQSALQDPTKVVQDPKNIERFAQYRTQGIGDVEAPFQQLQTARGTLGTQQEQLASGLETIQRDPNALQNFIQSQRVNPALATRGENVLDRFLTQSTESGQKAIAGLGTTAGVIRGTQAPSIIQDVESLRTQAQGGPLASSDVMNLLSGAVKPEEEFIRGIDKLFVARQSGVGQNVSDIESAKNQFDTFNNINNTLANKVLEKNVYENIDNYPNFKQNLYFQARNNLPLFNNNPPSEGQINAEMKRIANEKSASINSEINTLQNTRNNINTDTVNKYRNYILNINKNRQELLQQYDPTRLSRIQALQQLTGSTPFTSLLQGRIS